ncbi:hypothetical protein evm_009086 [Chilo suppressalis]|nr:hypothetical protein evm_009086 [Chilo suppressalis]
MVAVLILVLASVFLCATPVHHQRFKLPMCLTGYMTDVQSWVDERGSFTDKVDRRYAVELLNFIEASSMYTDMEIIARSKARKQIREIRYLSVARCGLTRIPRFFDIQIYDDGSTMADRLEYATFYGNNFIEVSIPGESYNVQFNATEAEVITNPNSLKDGAPTLWINGLHDVTFKVLKELDLRACGIQNLSPFYFSNMKALEALYLGENEIHTIPSNAFTGLNKLLHLDLSRNFALDPNGLSKTLLIEHANVFSPLESLKSIDFSHTKMVQRNVVALRNLSERLERISLCSVGSLTFDERFLRSSSIKILDISGVQGLVSSSQVLQRMQSSLKVLYATDSGIDNFDVFKDFERLEILKLSRNEITTVSKTTAESLTNLKVLDLSSNRLNSWFERIFSQMPSLEVLKVSDNNINIISEQMLADFANVSYLGLSGNSLVCNCRSKDLIELATRNELHKEDRAIPQAPGKNGKFDFHIGFEDINQKIALRHNISYLCERGFCDIEDHIDGRVLISDYSPNGYKCFQMGESRSLAIVEVKSCNEEGRNSDVIADLDAGWNKLLILLLLPCILLPLTLGLVFRRNLRYFWVTLRNSALISMVNKNMVIDDDTIFNYDVFVSYCHENRAWVLGKLLNHLEQECSVSLCLHERDFQVGLTILENIVSCMDRSKFIMLVISKQFLLSQWCQFEMHLAQHRLLETRREDLILILLEEIPRRLRPNNLHYLMLTKTYLVWPKKESEQPLFWKRLNKSVEAHKQRRRENASIA